MSLRNIIIEEIILIFIYFILLLYNYLKKKLKFITETKDPQCETKCYTSVTIGTNPVIIAKALTTPKYNFFLIFFFKCYLSELFLQ